MIKFSKKFHITVVLLFSCMLSNFALTRNDYKQNIYYAYIHSKMSFWEKQLILMEKDEQLKKDKDLQYDVLYYHYGYIGWALGVGNKRKAQHYLSIADSILSVYQKNNAVPTEIYALKSALVGFRIAISPITAPVNGIQSVNLLTKAMKAAPYNPLVWMENANSLNYRPSFLGGDKQAAVQAYEKTIQYFEKTPENLKNNWLYLNTHVTLGKTYTEINQKEKAQSTYKKILALEPDFKWAKDQLNELLTKTN